MYDNDPELDGQPVVEGAPADPYAIEALALPSGGKVEFRSLARLTGDDMRWIRGADDRQGSMTFWNVMFHRAMVKLVDSWDLTQPNGRPVPLPREKDSPYAKHISAFDLGAIEEHLKPRLDQLFKRMGSGDSEGE